MPLTHSVRVDSTTALLPGGHGAGLRPRGLICQFDAEPVSGRRPEPPFMELEYCSVLLKNEYCSVFLKNELSLRFLVINELS
jgi:hypothetical protein